MIQYVFIIGATGNVGKTLVRQIFECGDGDFRLHHNPTRIVGLASSKSYVFSRDGLSKKECFDFIEKKGIQNSYLDLEDIYVKTKEVGYGFERKLIFIDVTNSKDIYKFHLTISNNENLGLVTANKNPLTLDYQIFQKLTKNQQNYGYRCSVMAGAEAVSIIQDLKEVNDAPTKIYGCFSGTLGYICTELEKGRPLSEIIREAKNEGYTEPHPRDDLSGFDVARKLLILARTSGYEANMEDINIIPFIPQSYLNEDDAEKFMDSISDIDDDFSKKMINALNLGNTLRYVANMGVINQKLILTVGLQEVKKDSTLGTLKGTSNKITVISKVYSENSPYVVEAPGAGLEITAQNIRRDLLYQIVGRMRSK